MAKLDARRLAGFLADPGAARIVLIFFLTSLGTAIGVWTGGLRMLGTLFG